MAERAILARRRCGGRYDCYLSQWGGTNRALAAVCAGVSPSALPVSWEHRRKMDEFSDVVATLDCLSTEVLYRERQSGTTAFVSFWFGLPLSTASPSGDPGAVVEIFSVQDAMLLRDRFQRLKNALADALVTGDLPPIVAPILLLSAIAGLDRREQYVSVPADERCECLYMGRRPEGPCSED